MDVYRKQGYLLEKFRLFHLSSPGGTTTDFHYHEFCKVLFLINGSGSYTIDGQRYLLRPGDLVLIRYGSIHRPELDPASPYERIILYISPDFLREASSEGSDLMTIFPRDRDHVLRLGQKPREKLFHLVQNLEQDLASPGFGRELLGITGLLRLLIEIRRSRDQGQSLAAQMPENPRIREILDYIHRHLGEDLDIETIAGAFFLSKYHMMRLFRQETGTTIHLYITQKRLMLARELIRGGMKATEACYRSGFRSYSSFTRACEKHLGTTPTGKVDGPLAQDGDFE